MEMLIEAYMGGGGCQKQPKTCLRNLRMAPRACLFNDLSQFKGCPYLNHRISWRDELLQQN